MLQNNLENVKILKCCTAYGPSLSILRGVSQKNCSSPDVLNQEEFSRIFNILK